MIDINLRDNILMYNDNEIVIEYDDIINKIVKNEFIMIR
jgi:hypothetical protein